MQLYVPAHARGCDQTQSALKKKKMCARVSLMDDILHIFPILASYVFLLPICHQKGHSGLLVARSLTPRHESRVEVKVHHMSPSARKIRQTLRMAGRCRRSHSSFEGSECREWQVRMKIQKDKESWKPFFSMLTET